MFTNLQELIKSMPDEKQCRDYVIKERWNGVIVCPYCSFERAYIIENGKRFKCANKVCHKKFSVLTGTIFQSSKISVFQWLTSIYLMSANKKGISSYQLAKHIGTSQKTSWFMLHRIREALQINMPLFEGTIEADETFVGGKFKNKSKKIRKANAENQQSSVINKTGVMGILERGADITLKVMDENKPIKDYIKERVKYSSTIYTDNASYYKGLDKDYAAHESVDHLKDEYVRGTIHTNSIEGAFSHFKRMIIGTYHQLSAKHLQAYCNEFAYRYNTRKMKDAARFELTLQGIEKRLTYNRLVHGKDNKKETEQIQGEI